MVETADVRTDRLSLDRQVIQRARGHRSGTDDVLATFSAWRSATDAGRVLDLGCGHGTVTLLLSAQITEARFVCVEAQEISAALCRANLDLNGLSDRVELVHSDLRDLPDDLGVFDLITGTPPFMPIGSGVLPQDPQRAAARFELRGGIEAYCDAASRYLADGGRVSMLMDGAQDARVRAAFSGAGLRLTRVTMVVPRRGKAPRYGAYVAEGPGEGGQARVDELLVREADGVFSKAYVAIRRQLRLE